MLNVDLILNRLEGVAARGSNQWIARCPAHEDRHPSLSITDAGDKLLLKCFAECETAAVLAAIGLDWSDLYPPRPIEHQHRRTPPKPFTDRDLLLQESEDFLVAQGVLEKGDLIVITIGEPIGKTGGTNTMKIVRVGEQ